MYDAPGISRCSRRRSGSMHRVGVAARAHEQSACRWIELRRRQVVVVARVRRETLILDVLGDADDVGARRRVRARSACTVRSRSVPGQRVLPMSSLTTAARGAFGVS